MELIRRISRFKRDSQTIDHDIHIFAFITDDFSRMEKNTFLGYGKPFLSLENGLLVTRNVPVPKRSYYLPWFTRNLPLIKELRMLKLTRRLFYKFNPPGPSVKVIQGEAQKRDIISAVFRDLKDLNQKKNSIGVLLYLPTRYDYKNPVSLSWKQFLSNEAAENGLFFIDLIGDFQKLPDSGIDDLFIPDGAVDYIHAAGHYTEKGNRYIADTLYRKLIAVPEISERLNR